MNEEKEPTEKGVFLTKGMHIDISEFTISMSDDGSVNTSPITIKTGLDLTPYWLKIAFDHLLRTEVASYELLSYKTDNDAEKITSALESEFTSGMQSIMSSAIAMDAFYANVKEKIAIPAGLTEKWREKRTARYKQISEVLRVGFSLSDERSHSLRNILKQCTEWRDKSVHPPPGTTAPMLHPELNKVTDQRYVYFRYYNAKEIVRITYSVIVQLAKSSIKCKSDELAKYCSTLSGKLEPLVKEWEDKYGALHK